MLPVIDLDAELSRAAGPEPPLTYIYYFDWSELERAAAKRRENLEMLLTRHVTFGFYRKPLACAVLIWYAPVSGGIVLSVTGYGRRVRCTWLEKIPGFLIGRKGAVPPNGAPLFYWDQKRLNRLHVRSSKEECDTLVEDWGSFYGLSAEITDRTTYDRIRRGVATHFDYSAVPTLPLQKLTVGGKDLTVAHCFVSSAGCSG